MLLVGLVGHQQGVEEQHLVVIGAEGLEPEVQEGGPSPGQHHSVVEGQGPGTVVGPVRGDDHGILQHPVWHPTGPQDVQVLVTAAVLVKDDQPVVLCGKERVQNTEYFIHPVTGNYSVNSHIKAITNKQTKFISMCKIVQHQSI